MGYKESVLFVGGDSSGKTSLLLDIAKAHPDSKCIMFDWENKVQKIKDGYYSDLTNVEIVPILRWADVVENFPRVKKELSVGDWLLIDGVGVQWEVAQDTYDESMKEDKWQYVKRIHNRDFMDVACNRAPFNVAASSWAGPNDDFNIGRESDKDVKAELLMWKQFGFKPEGEKRNTSRFDTVFALKSSVNPIKHQIATYKDKVRPYIDGGTKSLWFDFSLPFWPLYIELCKTAKEEGETVILPE